MPKQISPKEALERVKGAKNSDRPTETVSTRVPVQVWRLIAEYAKKKHCRDMSTALRGILQEWEQDRLLGSGCRLEDLSTEALAQALRDRGMVVMDRDEFRHELARQFGRVRARMKETIEALVGREQTEKVVLRFERALT